MAKSRLRLLDLALSHALDNSAIHLNDANDVTTLREMHALVLSTLLTQEIVDEADEADDHPTWLAKSDQRRYGVLPGVHHLVIPLHSSVNDHVDTHDSLDHNINDDRCRRHGDPTFHCHGVLQRFTLKMMAWGQHPGAHVTLCVAHAHAARNNKQI
jgi:hypothetical protein